MKLGDVLEVPLSSWLLDPKFFITLTKRLGVKFLFTCRKEKKEKAKTIPQTSNLLTDFFTEEKCKVHNVKTETLQVCL